MENVHIQTSTRWYLSLATFLDTHINRNDIPLHQGIPTIDTTLPPHIFTACPPQVQNTQDPLQTLVFEINDLKMMFVASQKQSPFVLPHVRSGYESDTRSLDGAIVDVHDLQCSGQVLTSA